MLKNIFVINIIFSLFLTSCFLDNFSFGNNQESLPSESIDTQTEISTVSGIVSFSYDDGSDTWYNIGYPLFEAHGHKATFNLNASWTQTRSSWILEMYSNGYEFASHSYNHGIGVTDQNIQDMKILLDNMGITPTGFVGPGGAATPAWGHNEVNIVKNYHTYYSQGYSQSLSPQGISVPYDIFHLRRWPLTNNLTASEITQALEDSASNNTWIIFSGHDISGTWIEEDSGTGGSGQSPKLIEFVFSEIERLGIEVRTVAEVAHYYHPPGRVLDCSSNNHQEPNLTYFEEASSISMNTTQWNEYWHNTTWTGPRYIGSPVVYCHSANETLPIMNFNMSVPNGDYNVKAELIPYNTGSTYRIYYSFDNTNPSEYSVEISNKTEINLGSVTITNGEFNLYTQNADVVSGPEGYVGWAFIKLFTE